MLLKVTERLQTLISLALINRYTRAGPQAQLKWMSFQWGTLKLQQEISQVHFNFHRKIQGAQFSVPKILFCQWRNTGQDGGIDLVNECLIKLQIHWGLWNTANTGRRRLITWISGSHTFTNFLYTKVISIYYSTLSHRTVTSYVFLEKRTHSITKFM